MTNIRIFKVGARVETRGLEGHYTGTVIKIGRLRATIRMDEQHVATVDAIGRAKRPVPNYAFLYKNLRLIAD